MDDKDTRKWGVPVPRIKGNCLALKFRQVGMVTKIDENKFSQLFTTVNNLKHIRKFELTSGMKRMKNSYLSNILWWVGHIRMPFLGSCIGWRLLCEGTQRRSLSMTHYHMSILVVLL
jgi:hypothetical protein